MRKLLLLALLGCGPNYDRTVISNVIKATGDGEVSITRIRVPKNLIVKAHIESFDSDDKTMDNTVVSRELATMTIEQVRGSDHDFAFEGQSVGRTVIEVNADGKLVLLIDAEVVAQSPP